MARRLHVFIQGLVQGVGFRYATCYQARALGLTGWVRNCFDGRVEAEFEGPKDALEHMLAWCRQGPALSRVTGVDVEWLEDNGPHHKDFRIRT